VGVLASQERILRIEITELRSGVGSAARHRVRRSEAGEGIRDEESRLVRCDVVANSLRNAPRAGSGLTPATASTTARPSRSKAARALRTGCRLKMGSATQNTVSGSSSVATDSAEK